MYCDEIKKHIRDSVKFYLYLKKKMGTDRPFGIDFAAPVIVNDSGEECLELHGRVNYGSAFVAPYIGPGGEGNIKKASAALIKWIEEECDRKCSGSGE